VSRRCHARSIAMDVMAPAALSSHLPTSALSGPTFAHLIYCATCPASVQHCAPLYFTSFVSKVSAKYDKSGCLRVLIPLQAHPTTSHTASLPGLSAELFLQIIEYGPDPKIPEGGCRELPFHISGIKPDDQRSTLIALRTTCVELNAKLVYFTGSKYLKDIRGSLSEPGLLRLQEISKGPLRVHVEHVTIAVSTLFQQ
jgi:hypothetical protein